MDHEVLTNKQAIVEAFAKEPHVKNPDSDWEAELIRRLIEKGHDDLLPTLFAASEWADGALAGDLAYFFADRLRSTPQEFTLNIELTTQACSASRVRASGHGRDIDRGLEPISDLLELTVQRDLEINRAGNCVSHSQEAELNLICTALIRGQNF